MKQKYFDQKDCHKLLPVEPPSQAVFKATPAAATAFLILQNPGKTQPIYYLKASLMTEEGPGAFIFIEGMQ